MTRTQAAAVDRWRLRVVRDRCVGAGCCTALAGTHFVLDAERRSSPTVSETHPDPRLLEAANLCPVEAIQIVDLATGESVLTEP